MEITPLPEDDTPFDPEAAFGFDPSQLVPGEDTLYVEKVDDETEAVIDKYEGVVTGVPEIGVHNGREQFLGSIVLKPFGETGPTSLVVPVNPSHEVAPNYTGGSAHEYTARPVRYHLQAGRLAIEAA